MTLQRWKTPGTHTSNRHQSDLVGVAATAWTQQTDATGIPWQVTTCHE